MESTPIIELDKLIEPQGIIVLADGSRHTVLPADGMVIQLMTNAEGDGLARIQRGYRAVARCVPTLSDDQRLRLTPVQVAKVLAIASGAVEAVEAALAGPNGSGATEGSGAPSPELAGIASPATSPAP